MKKLTQARLKELFNYRDGVLCWKVVKTNSIKIGAVAGWLNKDGYHRIGIDCKDYKRSRLIYFYHHGYMPENEVDHINLIRNDDKINNLREASRICNARNCGNGKLNTSGVKGVWWDKNRNKWASELAVNYKKKYLGRYKSFDNAVCARLAGEQCLNWDGCDSNSPALKYVKENIQ